MFYSSVTAVVFTCLTTVLYIYTKSAILFLCASSAVQAINFYDKLHFFKYHYVQPHL